MYCTFHIRKALWISYDEMSFIFQLNYFIILGVIIKWFKKILSFNTSSTQVISCIDFSSRTKQVIAYFTTKTNQISIDKF
jgi:hypothetical protein